MGGVVLPHVILLPRASAKMLPTAMKATLGGDWPRSAASRFTASCRHLLPVVSEDVGRRPRGLSASRRYVLAPMMTPRARASLRQRLTRRSSDGYRLRVNRPGNWMHSSSKSCMALKFGRPSKRLHTIGQTMRSDWTRAMPRSV